MQELLQNSKGWTNGNSGNGTQDYYQHPNNWNNTRRSKNWNRNQYKWEQNDSGIYTQTALPGYPAIQADPNLQANGTQLQATPSPPPPPSDAAQGEAKTQARGKPDTLPDAWSGAWQGKGTDWQNQKGGKGGKPKGQPWQPDAWGTWQPKNPGYQAKGNGKPARRLIPCLTLAIHGKCHRGDNCEHSHNEEAIKLYKQSLEALDAANEDAKRSNVHPKKEEGTTQSQAPGYMAPIIPSTSLRLDVEPDSHNQTNTPQKQTKKRVAVLPSMTTEVIYFHQSRQKTSRSKRRGSESSSWTPAMPASVQKNKTKSDRDKSPPAPNPRWNDVTIDKVFSSTTNTPSTSKWKIRRTCDSGAATALASVKGLISQGIPFSAVAGSRSVSSNPVVFATGNGPTPAANGWTIKSDVTGEQQCYDLERCDVSVFSQGKTVYDTGKCYIWHPTMFDGKPFYVPAEKVIIQLKKNANPDVACRVKHCVPEFEETIELLPALTATRLDHDPTTSSDESDPEDNNLPHHFTEGDALAKQKILQYSKWAATQDIVVDYVPLGDEQCISCKVIGDRITKTLQQIPDSFWKSVSRRNVRPEGETSCKQFTLGLVSCATTSRIPTISKSTWALPELTRLIVTYVNKLSGREAPLTGTSIQIGKDLQSVLHVDRNNQGLSYITGLGEFTGGETFFHDPTGKDAYMIPDNASKIGEKGTVFRGSIKSIRSKVIEFNGKLPHGTMPFKGQRFALIVFSLGTFWQSL